MGRIDARRLNSTQSRAKVHSIIPSLGHDSRAPTRMASHNALIMEMVTMTEIVVGTIENPAATPVVIRPESPLHPKLQPIFAAKNAFSRSLYPAESDYALGPEELAQPEILFLVADREGELIGCGAAVPYPDYGEIKSMFVNAEARGQRIGERMIVQLEAYLRDRGKQVARLETGVDSHAALRLYTRMGYLRRGPYGDYADDPLCVFMEKTL